VDGCDQLVSKNTIWKTIEKAYGRPFASQLMPESFVTDDIDEMKLFYNTFNPSNKYILKKNIQRKEGLKITSKLDDIIRAQQDDFKIIQKYIVNVYTLNNYKVNFRMYVLLLCKNHTQTFYLYENGKCMYTNKPYSKNSPDTETQITSYKLDKQIYDSLPLTIDDFKKQTGNMWYPIRDKIRMKLVRVVQAYKNKLGLNPVLRQNVCFQLFGVDVILNEEREPFILEFNKGPDMNFTNSSDYNMKYELHRDMFSLVGLLPSGKENRFVSIYQYHYL